jgi:monovalent cation/hydrogen antiporter
MTETYQDVTEYPSDVRSAHYDVVLAAVAAGRRELLRMH